LIHFFKRLPKYCAHLHELSLRSTNIKYLLKHCEENMSEIFPFDDGRAEFSRSLPKDGFLDRFASLKIRSYEGSKCSRPPSSGYTRRKRSMSVTEDLSSPRLPFTASTAILFKNIHGQPSVQPLGDTLRNTQDDILNFFKCYKCYDLIPLSAKLVVLDTELVLKKAFFAMVDTGVRACPLWDSTKQSFVGMLTITDFIRILQKNYLGPSEQMEAFEEERLSGFKGITQQSRNLVAAHPDTSLYQAVRLLIDNKIHRLPIVNPEDGNVLYILNQKPLLKFLLTCVPHLHRSSYLSTSIKEAKVGTFSNIQVASEETTIIEALNRFVKDRISALPIVDNDGRLLSLYSKFDVINLAAEKTYNNLEVPLKDACLYKEEKFNEVQTCSGSDSVLCVLEKLVVADVNRLVVVSPLGRVEGIVTVSDIIYFLVLDRSKAREREKRAGRREDSIGEELELELEADADNEVAAVETDSGTFSMDVKVCDEASVRLSSSCSQSPPQWFNV